MIRLVIENLLLFLLPTFLYFGYMHLVRVARPGTEQSDAPLFWLFGAGALLVIGVLVVFGNSTGDLQGQGYTTPESYERPALPPLTR